LQSWGLRQNQGAERVVWARKFDEPISLPDGRKLIRLRDAADYIIAVCTENLIHVDDVMESPKLTE
jgi:hypothetical protein